MASSIRRYELCINGSWQSAADRKSRPLINPATEETLGEVACASAQDIEQALHGATRAFQGWSRTAPKVRGEILMRAAAILREGIQESAQALSEEQGKTIGEAHGEFLRAIETLEWNGSHAEKFSEPLRTSDERTLHPEALGVVAAFTPWNYPAVLAARKLSAPLAAGCPVILKAAEETPSAATAVVSALLTAGAPSGTASLLFGEPAMISDHLLRSPVIRAVTFTGSTSVGRHLAALAAPQLQRCVLELGGHAAVLVFDDCDLEAAVRAIRDYKFECAGQSCNAPSRIYVQESLYDSFVERMISAVQEITVGPGNASDTSMGPMANARRIDSMKQLTDDARRRGAKVLTGGARIPRKGFYWPPTLLTDVPPDAAIMSEEPFGPILPIERFSDTEDAITRANSTRYGLASFVFSRSNTTINTVAARLESGAVSVNCLKGVSADTPYGGIKDSGYGYEGGAEGFRAFQNLKVICRLQS